MPALKIIIFFVFLTTIFLLLSSINAAPAFSTSEIAADRRQAKNLAFLDYLPQEVDYENYGVENDQEDYDGSFTVNEEENELSRSIPNNAAVAASRKRIRPSQSAQFNSPIYYIRLPPQPYMFVPGLGYMSQPAPNPMSQFLNIPVNFVSNGKPNSIYQWTGGIQIPSASVDHPPTTQKPKPVKKPSLKPADSTIHRLPGQFNFNGRPDDIYVLGDSYNSLYGDVLQNLYP